MILIPIPSGFLRGRPPFVRRFAFWALLAGAVLILLSLTGVDLLGAFARAL